MSSRAPYDPWRDADGAPVFEGVRVEQVAAAKEHGALSRRLGQRGEVVDRAPTRLWVRFDGEQRPVSVRPHLVRVVARERGRVRADGRRVDNGGKCALVVVQEIDGSWRCHGLGAPGVTLSEAGIVDLAKSILMRVGEVLDDDRG
ncbi:MAG: hypothetical protein ACRDS9_18165 [Pseudonocardiaceae bacterium]